MKKRMIFPIVFLTTILLTACGGIEKEKDYPVILTGDIVFVSPVANGNHLFMMNSDGSNMMDLFENAYDGNSYNFGNFLWSPDGTSLAYEETDYDISSFGYHYTKICMMEHHGRVWTCFYQYVDDPIFCDWSPGQDDLSSRHLSLSQLFAS